MHVPTHIHTHKTFFYVIRASETFIVHWT